ncbi:MAG: HEAT repeat domain-containing protein [Chloroflexota bacterium]
MSFFSRKPELNVDEMEARCDVEGLIDAMKEWALTEQDKSIRVAAGNALVKIGQPAIAPLVQTMKAKDKSLELRQCAEIVLGAIGEPAIPHLTQILRGENEDVGVRQLAVSALGRMGKPAVEVLIETVSRQHPMGDIGYVGWTAIAWLGNIGDERAVKPLVQALKDEHSVTRKYLIEALVKIGEAAVLPLSQVLKDEDKDIRKEVASALGLIGDVRSLEALIEASSDRDRGVRNAANNAIKKIKSKKNLS